MLDLLGVVKTAADLLPRAWTSWQERRDPVRAQAARVLRAFEAHGITRTQIVRLLPPELPLPMTAFANAQSLRSHLTPALLDWVANYFLIERGWFDCVPDMAPHSPWPHYFYKQPGKLHQWLSERIGDQPIDYCLYALKSDTRAVDQNASGPLVMVLAENHLELDGQFLDRYLILSKSASFDHVLYIADMVASCAVADSLDIRIRGLVVPENKLQQLEGGSVLIAEALRRPSGFWKPEALLYGADSTNPWLNAVREQANEWLGAAGLNAAIASLNE